MERDKNIQNSSTAKPDSPDMTLPPGTVNMETMPLRAGHFRVLATASMEQIIGTVLSGLVGIIIPLINLVNHPELSSSMQGVLGAAGLIGIALGSIVIGKLSDRYGYLALFRLSPVLIMIGSLIPFIWPHIGALTAGLFVAGLGVGGGYSLDDSYISEIMPEKYKLFMVGVAKATSAVGFIAVAAISLWIIKLGLTPQHWNYLLLIMTGLGLLTFLSRIPFRNSPRWLLSQGEKAKAESAVEYFLGKDVRILPLPQEKKGKPIPTKDFFSGKMLKKVIFSGIPWACEGVGVYGVGVFLPILVLKLGLDTSDAVGMAKVSNSLMLTTIINCFILAGFVIGLLRVRKCWHVKMLTAGFIGAAIGLGVLLAAYMWHWPLWVSIAAFLVFELALNAGPHLITFIIPAQIYDVANRGFGNGISAMIGKVGAIIGVFIMPILLRSGGITLVLEVCIGVNLLGGIISMIFGPQVLPKDEKEKSAGGTH